MNPISPYDSRAPIVDDGPGSMGTIFDFGFRSLEAGESISFNMYYGAASNQELAERAAGSVDAEVFAFAKPSVDDYTCTDTPNTFIVAFNGVGGSPIFPH